MNRNYWHIIISFNSFKSSSVIRIASVSPNNSPVIGLFGIINRITPLPADKKRSFTSGIVIF